MPQAHDLSLSPALLQMDVATRRLADVIACSSAPATRRRDYLPPGVRSRLWLRGEWLPSRDAWAYLWLHPDDGRVLAFRLPADAFGDDGAIRELLGARVNSSRPCRSSSPSTSSPMMRPT